MSCGHIIALLEAGIASAAEMVGADEERLCRALGEDLAQRALAAATGRPRGGATREQAAAPCVTAMGIGGQGGQRPVLVVDSRRPDQATIGDSAVRLRPAEFRLLRALAAHPGRCVGYEEIYREMWGGEQFVEPAQIYSHRSRLGKKLGGALPSRAQPLIRTMPTHGLMLDLEPEQVQVR